MKETTWQKSSAFVSIYLSASMMYCNIFGGGIALVFTKITRVVFSGLRCITRGALWRTMLSLASCHLLLHVVYACQKSFHSINAFACYKQKCNLAQFNLAHSVYSIFHIHRVHKKTKPEQF